MSGLLHAIQGSENAERSKTFYDYLLEASKDKGIPFSGTFELTPRCNLSCPMCYVHLAEGQAQKKELSTRQWIDLIDQATKAGMMHACISGGECFLHPGFSQIHQALEARGVFIKILTNATLLDEKMVSWIARHPIEVIQVSVYGSSPEMYQATTGNASAFHLVDRALDLLREAGIRFEVSITASKQLAPYAEDILNYLKQKRLSNIRLSPNPFPARPETGKRPEDYRMSIDDTVAYYQTFYRLTGESALYCGIDREEARNEDPASTRQAHSIIPAQGFLCAAGKTMFCVTWDGWLVPCSAIDFIRANPFQEGFQGAWESIREAASAYRYPDECAKCGDRYRCAVCPGVHSNPSFHFVQCEETKRLIQEKLL